MDLSRLGQVSAERLRALLQAPVQIHSAVAEAHGLPRISITPANFVSSLLEKLRASRILVDHVSLEGSAAAHCICSDLKGDYNDLDLVFHLPESAPSDELHYVRDIVLQIVSTLLPAEHSATSNLYTHKMFLKTSTNGGDSWALFTFAACDGGPSIDIKFVQRCARTYQFSVDSLFVRLDDLLPQLADGDLTTTPVAGSFFGNLDDACAHLRSRIIAVADPAEMAAVHGGGLLKYAALLSRGFRAARWLDVPKMERFMCARFHIDFPAYQLSRFGMPVQLQRIHDYMLTHMGPGPQPARALSFVRTLRGVVARGWPHDPTPMLAMLNSMLPPQRRQPLAPQQRTADTKAVCGEPDRDGKRRRSLVPVR